MFFVFESWQSFNKENWNSSVHIHLIAMKKGNFKLRPFESVLFPTMIEFPFNFTIQIQDIFVRKK